MATKVLIIYEYINEDYRDLYLVNANEEEMMMFSAVHGVYNGSFIEDELANKGHQYIGEAQSSGRWDKYKIDDSKTIDTKELGGIDKIVITGFIM